MNHEADINPDEGEWTRVGCYPNVRTAHEHALVVLAMGLPCWIEAEPDGTMHALLVNPDDSERVARELEQYGLELEASSKRDTTEPGVFAHSPGWSLYLLWATILALIHHLQPEYPQLVALGSSSSIDLIEHGQWWRPFTALFLHADTEHLLGNLLSGLFFTSLVASSVGPWRGWLLILACGTLGNLATSLIVWPEAYSSIGASTAVFGALGILSGLGLAWTLRLRSQIAWLRVGAPVIAGIVVLGMTGSGAPQSNTDVMGHVFGFVAGVVAGTLTGSLISYTGSSGTSKAESDART